MRSIIALVAVFAAALTAATSCSSASGSIVPFRDSLAAGGLGLCDRAGKALTHGSTATAPFVFRAVSTVAAPARYAVAGRTATLFAFQPREGVDPGYWSGGELSSASQYTNPAHPMVQLTRGDLPLSSFLSIYPARWDGIVQLRMYLGAPDQPPYTRPYAATDLRIDGTTWTVVHPVDAPCDAGQATSLETELLPSASP